MFCYIWRLVIAKVLRCATAAALVVVLTLGAGIVCCGVTVLLARQLLALARIRVAVRAAERVWVRLHVRILVAAARRADVRAAAADADAVLRRPLTLAALPAVALSLWLHTAAAMDLGAADTELACASAGLAVAAVRRRGHAEALCDEFVAVVAGDILAGHTCGSGRRMRLVAADRVGGARRGRRVTGCGGHLKERKEA